MYSNGRAMLLSKSAVRNSKKSTFIKEKEERRTWAIKPFRNQNSLEEDIIIE